MVVTHEDLVDKLGETIVHAVIDMVATDEAKIQLLRTLYSESIKSTAETASLIKLIEDEEKLDEITGDTWEQYEKIVYPYVSKEPLTNLVYHYIPHKSGLFN